MVNFIYLLLFTCQGDFHSHRWASHLRENLTRCVFYLCPVSQDIVVGSADKENVWLFSRVRYSKKHVCICKIPHVYLLGWSNGETDNVFAMQSCRNAVNSSSRVHLLQQFFRQRVVTAKTKNNHTQMSRRWYFESSVCQDERFEFLSESDTLRPKSTSGHTLKIITKILLWPVHLSYVFLQTGYPVVSDDEPEFKGSESLGQWYLPVLKWKINRMENISRRKDIVIILLVLQSILVRPLLTM